MPIEVAFLRSFIGFLVLLIWCRIRSIKIPKISRIWLHLGALSLLLNTLPNFFFAFAETHVSSTLAGLVNATTPIFTILLVSLIIRNESLSKQQVIGVVLGFIGILFLIQIWKGAQSDSVSALLALFAAVLCFAISYPYINTFLKQGSDRSEALIVIQLGISSVSILPFAILNRDFSLSPDLASLISVITLGTFASGIAYVWNIEVTRNLGSAVSSSVSYLIPAIALISGYIFMGEKIDKWQFSGVILILYSIWYSGKKVK